MFFKSATSSSRLLFTVTFAATVLVDEIEEECDSRLGKNVEAGVAGVAGMGVLIAVDTTVVEGVSSDFIFLGALCWVTNTSSPSSLRGAKHNTTGVSALGLQALSFNGENRQFQRSNLGGSVLSFCFTFDEDMQRKSERRCGVELGPG